MSNKNSRERLNMKNYNTKNKEKIRLTNEMIFSEKEQLKIPKFYEESFHNQKFKNLIKFKEDESYEHCVRSSDYFFDKDDWSCEIYHKIYGVFFKINK